jgi:hypothetical protein
MERWKIEVEITFDPIIISSNPETSTSAMYRIKESLDFLLRESVAVKHYHILAHPTKCIEFD